MDNAIRLQVFISRSGFCSRRKAMEIIQQGRVTVNGKVVDEPSTKVDVKKDAIAVNGKTIQTKRYEYILLNKPPGVVTTKKDRFAKRTVLDLLPASLKYVHPIGRLDKDTEGLLLLTNDGDLTNKLTHPKFDVGKMYIVKIDGVLSAPQKERLEKGVVLEGKKTWPAEISKIKKLKDETEFSMTIHEGRNRQIRRMVEKIGHRVVFLKRIMQGSIRLGGLKPGAWRRLTEKEIQSLKLK